MTSQWEVIRFILNLNKQSANVIIAAPHYSILKCRIRNFLFIHLQNIPKSEFSDIMIRTTFFTKKYFRNKKVLTAEAMRTLLFYSDKHVNVNITPALFRLPLTLPFIAPV